MNKESFLQVVQASDPQIQTPNLQVQVVRPAATSKPRLEQSNSITQTPSTARDVACTPTCIPTPRFKMTCPEAITPKY